MHVDIPSPRRVLCALDVEGSPSGALAVASIIAARFRASLDALYAPAPARSTSGREERVRRLISEHNSRERLDGLLGPMSSSLDVTPYVTPGRPSTVILAHSERHASDLIVMGGSAPARFRDVRRGTLAPVSNAAGCAVLSVRAPETERGLRRILLPVGECFADGLATSWAIALATRFGAEVDVLPVQGASLGFWQALRPARVVDARAAEARMFGRSHGALSRIRCARIAARELDHLEHGGCDAVTALAETGTFDIVVVGLPAHGDGAAAGDALVGSLRRRSGVSVLSVRALAQNCIFAGGAFKAPRVSNDVDVYGVPA
jgi:nucleotide-binding universal stress UspA family protein